MNMNEDILTPEVQPESADPMAALTAENQTLREQLAALQAAYDAHLAAQAREEKQQLLRRALAAAGVSEQVAELLAAQVELSAMVVEDGTFVNEAEVVTPLRERWGELFLRPAPVSPVTPAAAPPLTREALSAMSTEEINSNWEVVKRVMAQ